MPHRLRRLILLASRRLWRRVLRPPAGSGDGCRDLSRGAWPAALPAFPSAALPGVPVGSCARFHRPLRRPFAGPFVGPCDLVRLRRPLPSGPAVPSTALWLVSSAPVTFRAPLLLARGADGARSLRRAPSCPVPPSVGSPPRGSRASQRDPERLLGRPPACLFDPHPQNVPGVHLSPTNPPPVRSVTLTVRPCVPPSPPPPPFHWPRRWRTVSFSPVRGPCFPVKVNHLSPEGFRQCGTRVPSLIFCSMRRTDASHQVVHPREGVELSGCGRPAAESARKKFLSESLTLSQPPRTLCQQALS